MPKETIVKKASTYGRRRRSPPQVCPRPGCGKLGCREHCQCPRIHFIHEPYCTRKGQARSPICSHCRVDETKDCDGFHNAPARSGQPHVVAWRHHVHAAPQLLGRPQGLDRGEDDIMRWYTAAPPTTQPPQLAAQSAPASCRKESDGQMSSADDGPYKGTGTPEECRPSCAQQQDPQPAAAGCIAARPLSQLGDAANSAGGIVRLEAEQDNPAGQACGASAGMRQEVTRLQGLAREFAVGLECAEDVDALSGGRSQEYHDRLTASLRTELLQMSKILGNLVREMNGFPGKDLRDPSLDDLVRRVRHLRRQLGFHKHFKDHLRRVEEAQECALCKQLIYKTTPLCRIECLRCTGGANNLRFHEDCIPHVRPGKVNRMCPICRERRGFRMFYVEH